MINIFFRKKPILELLISKGFFLSETQAHPYLVGGQVYCNGERVIDPKQRFSKNCKIEVMGISTKYCSTKGYQLEDALMTLGVSPLGKICIDAYANMGGFSDCLAQKGATLVYAVNNKPNVLCKRLYNYPNITAIDNVEISNPLLNTLSPIPMLATADFKKISAKDNIPYFKSILNGRGELICYIRPINEIDDKFAKLTGALSNSIYVPLINTLIDKINSYDGMAVQNLCASKYTKYNGYPEFFFHIMFGPSVVPFYIDDFIINSVVDDAIYYATYGNEREDSILMEDTDIAEEEDDDEKI
ncbi:MAG: hypothetical protein GYA87_05740 [Christensenellaceae bacterium]|nr:hypothetical protein [Christensenellaceae bacterium]